MMSPTTTMDHKWFEAVGQKLKELERAKANRYASPKHVDTELHQHQAIRESRFWHATDAVVPGQYFDWQEPRYPTHYLNLLRRESERVLVTMAERGYQLAGLSITIENQKTLMARIIVLRLEHLLPVT